MRWSRQEPAPPTDVVLRDAVDLAPADVLRYCEERAVDAALLGEHVEMLTGPGLLRDRLLVVSTPAGIDGVCGTGGNLLPLGIAPAVMPMVAQRLRRDRRRYSSIVGPADQVMRLWDLLADSQPQPRDVRAHQPTMVIDANPLWAPDPRVRVTTLEDLDVLMPACVAMFTEEVGYSPLSIGGGYERRVRSLVTGGRSLAWIEDGRVIFKAELGTVALGVTQVQGVWVDPQMRGRGIARAAMAAVVVHALRQVAPTVSLYVNDYNQAALAVYRAVGFREVGEFATVLF